MQVQDSSKFRLPEAAHEVQGFLNRPEPEPEGVYLDELAPGKVLEIQTRHTVYHVQNLSNGHALISGHPQYCPQPVEVDIIGSNWGGELPRLNFIAKGARLEFHHPTRGFIITSRVTSVRELTAV